MPLVAQSSFRPPWWLKSAHQQTLWPVLTRRVSTRHFRRERLELADGDFIDLDWSRANSTLPGVRRVAIVTHGLEGNSRRPYVAGLIRALNRAGWDALAWNFRGCSGEPNRTVRAYHSGSSDDLSAVIAHVEKSAGGGNSPQIALAGFSLGGNITLKCLAELGGSPGCVRQAVVFSVPCDLASAARKMSRPVTRAYLNNFLRTLRMKAAAKVARFSPELPAATRETRWGRVLTFQEFDDLFTAPAHGFRDAEDYWKKCSSKPMLPQITVPTLILSAQDDPFLTPACFPETEAAQSSAVWLEMPGAGGHVGFRGVGDREEYWHERRAVEFLADSQ